MFACPNAGAERLVCRRGAWAALALVLLAGCGKQSVDELAARRAKPGEETGGRPAGPVSAITSESEAPQLQPFSEEGETVYVSDNGDWTFKPPPRWKEQSRTRPTPGSQPEERMLVKYKRVNPAKPAWLRVVVVNNPGPSLTNCLKERAPDARWRRVSEFETIRVNGKAAVRVSYTGYYAQRNCVREMTTVQYGDRALVFTATCGAADQRALNQMRQAVATTDIDDVENTASR